MADTFTGSNYYKRSLTEYEVEACKRDAAKQDKDIWRWSLTEDKINPYDQQSETYSHTHISLPLPLVLQPPKSNAALNWTQKYPH